MDSSQHSDRNSTPLDILRRESALAGLLQLHGRIRNDVALLRRVNAAAREGDEQRATAELRRLSERTPARTLPTFCVAFCNVIRGHHNTEDSVVFPLLLEYANGRDDTLAQAIEKLKADHRELAAYLDRAEDAVAAPEAGTGSHAGYILDDLATKLTEHLDDEERRLAPALNALSRATPGRPVPPPTARHLHGFSPG